MRIVSFYFENPTNEKYKIFYKAFLNSVKINMPTIPLSFIKLPEPRAIPGVPLSLLHNYHKLIVWMDYLNDDTIFIDCDTVVLSDLTEAYNDNFDIALTKRKRKKLLNTGVVFYRPTGKDFFNEWYKWNKVLMKRIMSGKKYITINQDALRLALQHQEHKFLIKILPCRIWNACNEDWSEINRDTKMIHYKAGPGSIRHEALSNKKLYEINPKFRNAIRILRNYASYETARQNETRAIAVD